MMISALLFGKLVLTGMGISAGFWFMRKITDRIDEFLFWCNRKAVKNAMVMVSE